MNIVDDITLRETLCRLARFGANITDSHSCFLFLPSLPSSSIPVQASSERHVVLAGYHSLSRAVIEYSQIEAGTGLIGWVAQHNQPIHVSPFEHDSRTLGVYNEDCQLKSLIGIPLPAIHGTAGEKIVGVLMCDSKKSYAFSKLQGKLLNDLAVEVAHTINLTLNLRSHDSYETKWDNFLHNSERIIESLGRASTEIMRIRLTNFDDIEKELGASRCIDLTQQLQRLVEQALPPHYAFAALPNGDMVICLDNMMSTFYENKIKAVAKHTAHGKIEASFEFHKKTLAPKEVGSMSLEEVVCSLKPETQNTGSVPPPRTRGRRGTRRGNQMEALYELSRA